MTTVHFTGSISIMKTQFILSFVKTIRQTRNSSEQCLTECRVWIHWLFNETGTFLATGLIVWKQASNSQVFHENIYQCDIYYIIVSSQNCNIFFSATSRERVKDGNCLVIYASICWFKVQILKRLLYPKRTGVWGRI